METQPKQESGKPRRMRGKSRNQIKAFQQIRKGPEQQILAGRKYPISKQSPTPHSTCKRKCCSKKGKNNVRGGGSNATYTA